MMISSFFFIFFCLAAGSLLRVSGKFPKNTAHVLNAFIIWVSLPALIIIQILALLHQIKWGFELLIPVSMAWVQFVASFLIFYLIGKKFKWSKAEIGALILTAGLGNTSFLGFPILVSFFGPDVLRIAVLIDQLGSFLVLASLGIITASFFSPVSGNKVTLKDIIKRVIIFPPFIALIAAIFWHFLGSVGGDFFLPVLQKLSDTVVPLALIAVGFQLKVSLAVVKRQCKPLLFGLGFKLILSPLIFIILYAYILSLHSFPVRVTILQAAMAPMITAAVVAEEFGLSAEIANLMVGVGIPLSIITVFLWNQLPVMRAMH